MTVGFDSITLDPSPNLRRNRIALSRPHTMATAWENVAIALKHSIKAMEEVLTRTAQQPHKP